jgi:hypothetical protein
MPVKDNRGSPKDPPLGWEADGDYSDKDLSNVCPVTTGKVSWKLTPEGLTKKWGCGLAVAKQSLEVTTRKALGMHLLQVNGECTTKPSIESSQVSMGHSTNTQVRMKVPLCPGMDQQEGI